MTAWTFSGSSLDGDGAPIVVGSGERETLPGRFALTGLVDAHAHLTLDDGRFLDRRGAEQRLDEYAGTGVALVRDVGGLNTITLDLAGSDRPGRPRVVAAGRFLSSPERYFPWFYTPTTSEDLVAAVEAEVRAGAEWIKIVGDFPLLGPDGRSVPDSTARTYPTEVLQQAVAAAHRLGARVAVHANLGATDLIEMGVDSIEHGTALTPDDIDLFAARGGAWTPTLCAVLSRRDDPDPDVRLRVGALRERLRATLTRAVETGLTVMTGTDVVGTLAGEVALLVEHGLSVEQALRAATSSAREYLGVAPDDDLVTYDRDPREDPSVLREPAAVVVRGVRIA